MRNLPFVIWVLGWPAIYKFTGGLKNMEDIGIIFFLIIWFTIGKLLYEKKPKEQK